MRTEFGFARTACGCKECTHNCEHMPGYTVPADLQRLYEASSGPEESMMDWARRCLRASPGALVGAGGRRFRIPTLVPARQESGHCMHLEEGRCAVHEASPFGCAFTDAHMPDEEVSERSLAGLRAIAADWAEDGLYSVLWKNLSVEGLEAPGPEECRRKMHEAWIKKTEEAT